MPGALLSSTEKNKIVPYSRSKIFLGIMFGMIVVAVICITLFQYYQSIVSFASLQGYWNIVGNYYLLISDHTMQIILLTNNNADIIYSDDKISINYKSILATSGHTYEITRSNSDKIDIVHSLKFPFDSKVIKVTIFPANGIIDVSDEKISTRLVKDNGMSIAYLSSRNI